MINSGLAIISSTSPSEWVSCRVITPNLLGAYQLAYQDKIQMFSYTDDQDERSLEKLTANILASRPSKIVFIDHKPHPIKLLKRLKQAYAGEQMPALVFHVYGDFTLYTQDWYDLSEILKTCNVKFFCASPRQKVLLSRFLVQTSGNVEVCPFPVNQSNYFCEETIREMKRKSLNLGVQDKLIVYTGRLCAQKNVLRLVSEIGHLIENSSESIHLVLAGFFDDGHPPFFGPTDLRGTFYQKFLNLLQSFPPHVQSRIHYVGCLENQELHELYNAADLFASLSTYHDEDYGMSPIEALFCGCPVLLTDWGGYAGFGIDSDSSEFVDVKVDEAGPYMSSVSIQQGLMKSLKRSRKLGSRSERAKLYQQHFSLESVSRKLLVLHSGSFKRFPGFNNLMRDHKERSRQCRTRPFFFDGFGKKSFYYRVYKSYLGGTK